MIIIYLSLYFYIFYSYLFFLIINFYLFIFYILFIHYFSNTYFSYKKLFSKKNNIENIFATYLSPLYQKFIFFQKNIIDFVKRICKTLKISLSLIFNLINKIMRK